MAKINKINEKIGFIGAGNMGGAIIKGIISNDIIFPSDIIISDPNEITRNEMASNLKCKEVSTNKELMANTQVVIIAVKQNILPIVLNEIKNAIDEHLIISIVAGVEIKRFKEVLGEGARIVRTMPNTPSLVSEGMTVISYDDKVTTKDKAITESIFKSIGKIEIFSESLMNEVIALTSSSPAYVFQMIEAMADGAVLHGIPRDKAYKMAAQAILGSAKLLLETGKHPGELKDMVCSPGGTTIEAVAELEKCGFRNALISAMKACTEKAYKL